MDELRGRALAWHSRFFPDATALHVGLKLCEEAGEVARAINGLEGGLRRSTGGGDVGEEAADVLIALTVLLARYYPEFDLVSLAHAKLDRMASGPAVATGSGRCE